MTDQKTTTEPTPAGPPEPGSDSYWGRVETALQEQLAAIATGYEQKALEGVTQIVERLAEKKEVPAFIDSKGNEVVQTSRAWDSSPERMRIPEDERVWRTADGDEQILSWMRCSANLNYPGQMTADQKLRQIFPQAYRERADTLEGAASESGGFAAGTGGVLVPRPLENLVTIAIIKRAKLPRWVRQMTMTAQEHNIPTAKSATAYAGIGETTSPITGGEPALAQVPLVTEDLMGKMVMSRNLLEDEAANVVPVFVQLMGDAIGKLEDSQIIRTGSAGAPGLAKMTGVAYSETTSGALGYQDVAGCYYALPQQYRDDAMWLVNGTVLSLMANVRDGQGRPFYSSLLQPPMVMDDSSTGNRMAGAVGTLLGKPVHEVDSTAGDVYFGDPFRNYTMGRRRGLTVESSRDARFETRRIVWLVSERVAGNNIDTSAGQLIAGITSATSL